MRPLPGQVARSNDGVFNAASHYGAKADGTTDDTDSIAAGLADAKAESGTLFLPPGDYRTTAELLCETPARIDMHTNARIISEHNGAALTIRGMYRYPGTWNVTVEKKAATQWHRPASTDTTSVGLQLEGHSVQSFNPRVVGFVTGLYLAGAAENGEISSCSFFTPFLGDNKVNLKFDSVSGSNTGFANENKFFGGKLFYTSLARDGAGDPHPGSRNIWIGERSNGNVFFGTNLEGDACERTIYCEGFYNAWYHARFEYSAPIEFVAPDAYGNLIHYGTFFNGVDDIRNDANPIVIDPNRHNSYKSIWGDTNWSAQIDGDGRAMRLTTNVAAATYPALEVARGQTTGDDSTGVVQAVITHDGRFGMMDTSGTMRYLVRPTGTGAATWT
jgi:hypothetical protein